MSTTVDSFEDGGLGEYTNISSGSYTVATSGGYNGSNYLSLGDSNIGDSFLVSTTGLGTYPQKGDTFEVYVDLEGPGSNDTSFFFGATGESSSNSAYEVCWSDTGKYYLGERDFSDSGQTPTRTLDSQSLSSSSAPANGWGRYVIDWGSNDTITVDIYDETGTKQVTLSATDATYANSHGIGFAGESDSGSPKFDYIHILDAPAAPSNVSQTVNANDSISVTWNDNSRLEHNFHVQVSRDGSNYQNPTGGPTQPGANSTSANYNPNSDQSYQSQIGIDSTFKFRVRAENDNGASSWSYSGTVNTDPLPPHNPRVRRPDRNTIELKFKVQSDIADVVEWEYREDTGDGYGSWIAPRDANQGSEKYIVSGDQRTKGNTVTYQFKAGVNYEDTTFKSNARYQFRLRYYNNNHNGVTSEWVYATYDSSPIFSDDFEDQNLTEWDVIGSGADTSDPDPSVTNNTADEGTYSAHLDGEEYLQENLGDLTGSHDVLVKLAIRINSMDASSERVEIQWYDGAAWQTLKKYNWAYNDQGWFEAQALVPNGYLSTDNRVRFKDPSGWSGDDWWLDRVAITTLDGEYTQQSPPITDATGTGTTTADVTWSQQDPFADGSWTVYRATTDARGTSQTTVSAQNAFKYFAKGQGLNTGDGTAYIYVDGTQQAVQGRGMNTVLVRGGEFIEAKSFDTYNSTTASDNLESYIEGLNKGDLLMVAVDDEASNNLTSTCISAIETNLNSTRISELGYRDSWAIVSTVDVERHSEAYFPQYTEPALTNYAPITYGDTNLTHDTTYTYSVQRTLDGVETLSAPARAITDADSNTVDQTTLRIDGTRSVGGVTDDALGDHTGDWEHGYRYGDLQRGLLAHWRMNEGGGDVVRDAATDYHGVRDGATWTTSSNTGPYALAFDGSSSHVDTTYSGLGGDPPLTISVWASSNQDSTWYANNQPWASLVDLEEGESTSQSFVVCASDDGHTNNITVHFWGSSCDSGLKWEDLGLGSFHHIVGVNDPQTGEQRIYINGTLEGTSSANLDLLNGGTLNIGRRQYRLQSHYFSGRIDDVRIYTRALSEPEITALYNRVL